jgi:hydroxymethylglutaryl-CoA lyase
LTIDDCLPEWNDPMPILNPLSTLPAQAEIVEVGLRDGFQSLANVIPLDYKIRLIDDLIAAGIRSFQITSFVHPQRVPQMADAEALCVQLTHRETIVYSGLVLNVKGVERAMAAGLTAVDMGVPATETFCRRNINCTLAEGMARLETMISMAKRAGLHVRAGIQAAFGCAYEGQVAQEHVVQMVRQIVAMGADELSLSDSTGMANPLQIERMITAVRPLTGRIPITLHLHDTYDMGIANVYAALRQGVTRFDAAFGGLGGCPFIPGAKGNIATEEVVAMLEAMNVTTGIDKEKVRAVAQDFNRCYEN